MFEFNEEFLNLDSLLVVSGVELIKELIFLSLNLFESGDLLLDLIVKFFLEGCDDFIFLENQLVQMYIFLR